MREISLCLRAILGCLLTIFLAGLVLAETPKPSPEPYDILILHGQVLDGTGSPWFYADLGIRAGRIAAMGRLEGAAARRIVDARGLAVAPGFIDLHTHSDYSLLIDGNAQSKIRQGVTTEVLGEHESAAPLLGLAREEKQQDLAHTPLKIDWTTFDEYFARLKASPGTGGRSGPAVNVATYVGAGTIRMAVVGGDNRAATPEELSRMEALVEQAMQQGAFGLSSGLIYPPNSFSSTEELVALARVAGRYGGIYASHIRNEGVRFPAAIAEAIEIGRQAQVPVHIYHFKVSGKNSWGRMPEAVKMVEEARAQGMEVTVNQYPYAASQTGLSATIPQKYREGGRQKFLPRLRDPAVREEIKKALTPAAFAKDPTAEEPTVWETVVIASTHEPQDKQYEGHNVAELARMTGKHPVDFVADLLLSENGTVSAVYHSMSEQDVAYAMRQPWLAIGSDGTAINPTDFPWSGKPHPRFYGAHARVLGKYVRDEHVLTLADAVRKMTSLPANILGLRDRGVLRPEMAADIVIFNPETVADRATFESPHQYATGIEYVLVNGVLTIDRGEHTGARAGQILLGPGKQAESLKKP